MCKLPTAWLMMRMNKHIADWRRGGGRWLALRAPLRGRHSRNGRNNAGMATENTHTQACCNKGLTWSEFNVLEIRAWKSVKRELSK